MKIFSRLAVVVSLMIGVPACTGVATWYNDHFTTGSAPQANSVAAAEGFYTAADNSIAGAISQGVLSADTVTSIRNADNEVYTQLVPLRQAAQNNNSVAIPALLAAFNVAYKKLYGTAAAAGVTVAVPTQPVQTNGGTQ